MNKSTMSTKMFVFYAGLGGLVVSMVSTLFISYQRIISLEVMRRNLIIWLQMLCVSVTGVLGFLMLNQAVKLSNPLLVSFIRVTEIVISYAVQVFLFGQPAEVCGILGSVSSIIDVLLVSMEQHVRKIIPTNIKTIL